MQSPSGSLEQEVKVIQERYALFASGSECIGGASKKDKVSTLKEKGVDPLVKVLYKISETLGTALGTFAGQDAIALFEPRSGVLRFLDNRNQVGNISFVGACSDGMSIGTGVEATTLEENALTARALVTQVVQVFSEQNNGAPNPVEDVFANLFNSAIDNTYSGNNPRKGEATLTLAAIARKQDGTQRVVVCSKGDSPVYIMGMDAQGNFQLYLISREDTVAARKMENVKGPDFVKQSSATKYYSALEEEQNKLGDIGAALVADARQRVKPEEVLVFDVPSFLQSPHLLYGSDCLEKLGPELKGICEDCLKGDPTKLPNEIMKALLSADADDNTFAVKKIG